MRLICPSCTEEGILSSCFLAWSLQTCDTQGDNLGSFHDILPLLLLFLSLIGGGSKERKSIGLRHIEICEAEKIDF